MNECPGTVGRFIVIAHASPTWGGLFVTSIEYKPVLVYYWIGIRIGVGVDTGIGIDTTCLVAVGLYALNLSQLDL
jgi:hypothetical protein